MVESSGVADTGGMKLVRMLREKNILIKALLKLRTKISGAMEMIKSWTFAVARAKMSC